MPECLPKRPLPVGETVNSGPRVKIRPRKADKFLVFPAPGFVARIPNNCSLGPLSRKQLIPLRVPHSSKPMHGFCSWRSKQTARIASTFTLSCH